MPSLYIDRKTTELKLEGEVLICYEKGERIATIPLAPVDRLYMKGEINVQASLLAKLGEKGIGVVFLQGRKNEPMLFLPQPHNDAKRRLAQYHLAQNEFFSLTLAKNIVLHKAVAQKAFIGKFAENQPDIINCCAELDHLITLLAMQTSKESLQGIEGRMAVVYFSALQHILPAELGFTGRNRRPPKDPMNAALSFGYTLLYSEATLALYSAGLDPYIGFFHSLNYGRKSLACDIMEQIRPHFDEWLTQCFLQNQLRVEHFSNTNEGCLLNKEGRIIFYNEFEKAASLWRKRLAKQAYELTKLVCEYQVQYHQTQFDDYHQAILTEDVCNI